MADGRIWNRFYTDTDTDTDTDVYYTLAAKKPDSLIMGLENTIEQ